MDGLGKLLLYQWRLGHLRRLEEVEDDWHLVGVAFNSWEARETSLISHDIVAEAIERIKRRHLGQCWLNGLLAKEVWETFDSTDRLWVFSLGSTLS